MNSKYKTKNKPRKRRNALGTSVKRSQINYDFANQFTTPKLTKNYNHTHKTPAVLLKATKHTKGNKPTLLVSDLKRKHLVCSRCGKVLAKWNQVTSYTVCGVCGTAKCMTCTKLSACVEAWRGTYGPILEEPYYCVECPKSGIPAGGDKRRVLVGRDVAELEEVDEEQLIRDDESGVVVKGLREYEKWRLSRKGVVSSSFEAEPGFGDFIM